MANIQIPNLPAVVSLAGVELFEGVQSGTSVKISLSQIIAATRAGLPTTLPIPVSLGGTGAVTLTGYVKGSGTSPLTASATIPSGDITGLGTMSVQNANAVAITGGSVTGITDITVSDGGTGVSTLTGYVKGSGTSPLTASATIPSSDISGLGTMATQNANAVAITGGAAALTGVSSVTVSSASSAFTVKQTGSGNAILVEDETSPDSTPFVVSATGSVGIGTTSPTSLLNLSGETGVNIKLSAATVSVFSSLVEFNKSNGTIAAPTAIASGDQIGENRYLAYDGSSQRTVASIKSWVDTFTGLDDLSGRITFSTRPSGAGNNVLERLRIGPAGQFGIGGAIYGTSGQTIVSAGSAAAPAWGTLPVSGGGTGVTTAPAEAARILGYTSTATTAATTTLNNVSTQYQLFTGATTQTITLPVTSTLTTGWSFHIVNNSTGSLTVNSSGGNLVTTIISGVTAMVTCIGTTLTTAADWEAGFTDFQSITGTGANVLADGATMTNGVFNGTVGATTPATGIFTTVSDAAGNVRDIVNNAKVAAYILAATDNGEMINITTGGVTVNSGIFSAGNNVTIYNNSAASQTVTQGAGVTLRLAGSATTGNRTLAQRGICTIVCVASNEFVVSGAGVT